MQQPASGGAFTRGAYAAAPPKKTQAKYPPLLDSKVRSGQAQSEASHLCCRRAGERAASDPFGVSQPGPRRLTRAR